MSCKNVCKLCNHLVISQSVAFTGGNLVVTLPAGSYSNGEKYCIVIAQSIPEATTITAPVMIQIGTRESLLRTGYSLWRKNQNEVRNQSSYKCNWWSIQDARKPGL